MRIERERFVYDGPGGLFEGWVCWNNEQNGPRPAVMVAHTFKGQSEFEVEKAAALAALGYVGFAIDLYGQGRRAHSSEEAMHLMNALDADRALLGQRILGALETMKTLPQTDPHRTAAIGFSFGGKAVLDLARLGAETQGVVIVSGFNDAPTKPIKTSDALWSAAVLLLHGWDDPLSPPDSVFGLARELTERRADWQMHLYGRTGHSFTDPEAQSPEQGLVYQPESSADAWAEIRRFLEKALTRREPKMV